MVEQIYVTLCDERVWAVKNGAEYLGFTPDRDQAVRMGRRAVEWLAEHGERAELHIGRSFAPDDE